MLSIEISKKIMEMPVLFEKNIRGFIFVVCFHCVHSGTQKIVFGSGTALTVELRKITHFDICSKQKHLFFISQPFIILIIWL